MPSIMEGFGLVFLEAMSHNLPVIGGNVGGTNELIQDGVNGILVNPLDSCELTMAIETVLTNKDFRYKIIEGGMETIRGLNTELMINETYSYYTQILEKEL